MTAREAADYLRWPVKRIYNLTAARAIPCPKHEGRILLNRNELDEWLACYQEGPRRRCRPGL
jgi:excisionase family DNA binding protein